MQLPLSSFGRAAGLGLLIVTSACGAHPIAAPKPKRTVSIEITGADSGHRFATVSLIGAPPETSNPPRPIGLLFDVELAGDGPAKGRCYVEIMTTVRSPGRVELRTRVTRVDDDAMLRNLFESRMLEHQLWICDQVPCSDRGTFEGRLSAAGAKLSSIVSIELVNRRGPWRFRVPVPGGREDLTVSGYVVSGGS